jgi:RNA-directed DNA polymerase
MRFVDDIVVGFEKGEEAEQFQEALRQRCAKFGLELHPEKTRLIACGRFAQERRRKRGLGKPASFTFLGFTPISGQSRKGRLQMQRRTIAQRFRAKLAEVKAELRRRMHLPVPVQGAWLRSVLLGYYQY